ncbi:rhodanese-like domain-containing protein [Alkalihalobacillus sp. BA299]|uniref:rhodanese-like domain-containing protein n=1 Tax=Alkalihalobacillus sp. BA299 TaxID=2815938 RepID=UPI001ADD449F|nr:rhodanese-like domain-containing protein [Alkalihalobacillus sp. BA299]
MKQKTTLTILSLVIGIGVLFLFFGTANDQIQEITTSELETKMKTDKNSVFIDVREIDEYEEAHVQGMTNIPLSRFENEYTQLPKDQEIVLFCRSGNRSMQAASFLSEQGYKQITNVTGGILSWDGPLVTK